MRLATLIVPACLALQASAGWFGSGDSSAGKEAVAPAGVAPEKAADPFAPGAEATAAAGQTPDGTTASQPTKARSRVQTLQYGPLVQLSFVESQISR